MPKDDAATPPFWLEIQATLPKLVSWLDREPQSPTYGSFDRTFWCWKFTDFSAPRFQEGCASLAWLWATDAPGNAYFRQDAVLRWVSASLAWWQRLQHVDGSFDEAYPFERSFAATAFTCFYVADAVRLTADALDPDISANVLAALRRGAKWLCRNDETHGILSNHLAAGAAALASVGQLVGEPRFTDRSTFFLDRILEHQSSEGWYEEYGGADPGYQTHGMFYLARLWELSGDQRLLASLRAAAGFLAAIQHPDGSLGGVYASRNTRFCFPAAFEILAPQCEQSMAIAGRLRVAVRQGTAIGLRAMDAWNFLPMLNNYMNAHRATATSRLQPAASGTAIQGQRHFRDAGWLAVDRSRYRCIVAASKGGVVCAWPRTPAAQRSLVDAGYWARLANGRIIASQGLDRSSPITASQDGMSVEMTASFRSVGRTLMTPWLFLGFRGFTLTIGRMPWLAGWLKRLLVRVLVTKSAPVPLRLRRRVTFADDGVTIVDVLERTGPLRVAEVWRGGEFQTIHMGSSRYAAAGRPGSVPEPHRVPAVDALAAAGTWTDRYSWKAGEDA